MADYMNPAAGLPDANIPNNPFWSGVNESVRERTMAPFLGMQQEREGLELQKQRQTNQEFMSPDAQRARMSGFGATEAQNIFNAAEAKQKLSLLPEQKKLQIEQLSNQINDERAKPVKGLLTQLGGMAQRLEKMPEQHRPIAFRQELQRWQQMNPGSQIPEQFREYNPAVLDELKNIEYALVFTPKHQQDLGMEGVKGANRLAEQRLQNEGSANVASIQQRGATDRQGMVSGGKPVNIPQRTVQLRRMLANPDTPAEEKETAKEELIGYVTESFQKFEANDPVLKSLAGMAGIPGKQGEDALKRYETQRQIKYREFLQQQGLGAPAQPKPTDNTERVSVTSPTGKKGTIPKSQLDAALKNGYKQD